MNSLPGQGPCNHERIEARRKAWEGGKWVRDSAAVYAQKQAQQSEQKVA
jgi:ring-1,2-phenylacetyl-CoA epoxidase subunit PaaA